MAKRVDFVFTKNWGLTEKGTVMTLRRATARELQDIHKVGKIQKAVKPDYDKAEPKAKTRATK